MDVTQNLTMQYILLLGSLFGLIVCILLFTKHNNKKSYIIAPLTYFINSFLFYLTIELRELNISNIVDSQELLFWSTIVRLHALVIILVYVIIEPSRDKNNIGGIK